MNTRALLFDLDGTLVDSLADLADTMNEVLASLGHPTHPESAYRRLIGDGVRALVERALPSDASLDPEPIVERFRALYAERMTRKTRPYAGVPEMLAELAGRGAPLGVLSNKPHDATRRLVSASFPDVPFRVVLGAREGVPRKPDPTAALEAAAALGAVPEATWFVGDTSTDMGTAVAARMVPVGVTWGFRDEAELRESGARHVVHAVAELRALLASAEPAS